MKISELMQLTARVPPYDKASFWHLMRYAIDCLIVGRELAREPGRVADLWRGTETGRPCGLMAEVARVVLAVAAAARVADLRLAELLGDVELERLGGETFLRGRRSPVDWVDALDTAVLELRSAYLHRRDAERAAAEAASALRVAGAIWERVSDRLVPESVGKLLESADLFKWQLEPVCLWSVDVAYRAEGA